MTLAKGLEVYNSRTAWGTSHSLGRRCDRASCLRWAMTGQGSRGMVGNTALVFAMTSGVLENATLLLEID